MLINAIFSNTNRNLYVQIIDYLYILTEINVDLRFVALTSWGGEDSMRSFTAGPLGSNHEDAPRLWRPHSNFLFCFNLLSGFNENAFRCALIPAE